MTQDGNLYILWKDSSNHPKVRRFEFKDGSYTAAGGDLSLPNTAIVFAIAVDISDGRNFLYCAYEENTGHIYKYSWGVGSSFSSSSTVPGYDIPFNATPSSPVTTSVTALAANKDGVFVAVKETSSSLRIAHGVMESTTGMGTILTILWNSI